MKLFQGKLFSSFARKVLAAALVAAAVCFFALLPAKENGGGMSAVTAEASSSASISVEKYTVEMDIAQNRRISVREEITVRFLKSGLTMFYRSLPIDQGDKYLDFSAECEGNDAFSWYVADNPDMDGFIDVNCVGNAGQGKVWRYKISYTMISTSDEVKDGMLLDVVGEGWPVQLNDVDVTVKFPGKIASYEVYSGGFGSSGNQYVEVTPDAANNALLLHADNLPLEYNDTYNETMAAAVTLRFAAEAGVLRGYTASRIFTARMGVFLLVGVIGLGLSVLMFFLFRKKREIIPVVGLKAPQDMDPLRMGKLIDGTVNDEDITSMIYWFASKGYLFINFEDEKNPVLVRRVVNLPEGTPAHQKVLFDGLFKGQDSVAVSSLANKFYASADKAKTLLAAKEIPYYEKKSEIGFILCCVLSALTFFCVPFFASLTVGGGYKYFGGFFMAVPVVIVGFFLRARINLRYKSKGSVTGWLIAILVVEALATLFYIFFQGKHIIDTYEKLLVAIFAWSYMFIGAAAVSRTEEYTLVLGEILGFKEFITVTEEDKIKFMLEDNPELFYDILPYAQVLGVTKEWEDKFKNILLQPPSWYVGSRMTIFDYMLINACLRRATASMMTRPQSSGGGSFVGRSGGGGSFGGFSGGGHGGGGGGAR